MNRVIKGAVFVYPTETSYGIGCDARDKIAVAKIFKIKGRVASKKMTLIAADFNMVKKFVDARTLRIPEVAEVMRELWPGPLTLVLPANAYARKNLAPQIISKNGTIAIRVPDNQLAREISQQLQAPIVATSANKAGKSACYSAAAVRRAFKNNKIQPDLIIDEGTLPKRKPSTIAEFTGKTWNIIRAGSIKI
ncbi:MAG: L-threonylcarbamoyladenylate synthase [Candidatus Magasanikbacteria bacterium]|nr:L-threonylcarbamoyladenylate synthase [Candidatus Magasanikbacteria bacterium]